MHQKMDVLIIIYVQKGVVLALIIFFIFDILPLVFPSFLITTLTYGKKYASKRHFLATDP